MGYGFATSGAEDWWWGARRGWPEEREGEGYEVLWEAWEECDEEDEEEGQGPGV